MGFNSGFKGLNYQSFTLLKIPGLSSDFSDLLRSPEVTTYDSIK